MYWGAAKDPNTRLTGTKSGERGPSRRWTRANAMTSTASHATPCAEDSTEQRREPITRSVLRDPLHNPLL